jgi:DNA polymerase-3 subunit alpha
VGQFDLFGGLDDGGSQGVVGLDLVLSPIEWDKKTLLSSEREMLGLYVSDHPLAGTERILRANSEQTIAQVVDDETPDRQPVTIAGMISSVQRRITKQGASWAIAALEDLDASVEVLFFPKSYELLGPYLAEDAVVKVQGHVNRRDGAVSVVGSDLAILDISNATTGNGEPPVTLVTSVEQITEHLVGELRRCLRSHPGAAPVQMRLRSRTGEQLLALSADFKVSGDAAFRSEIKVLLGPSGID